MLISSFVGSIPRAFTTGCCGSLFRTLRSSVSDLAFSSEWTNRTHLSRIRLALQSPFLVTDALRFNVLRRLQLHRFYVLEKSMLLSHPQILLQLNDVALEETNDCCTPHSLQPVTTWIPDGLPQLRTPGVHFQALSSSVHRISRSLELSFCLGVPTPTLPWSPSFPGWCHDFSGSHNDCGECGFHVVHIAVSRQVCPEVPSNSYGHLLSKLKIGHQAPTIHWCLR